MKKQLLIVWSIVVSAMLYAENSAENYLDLCVKHKDYLLNHEKDIGLKKKQ